jgi:predicted HAD superfamily Cof-like phosphohydrolase
VLNFVKDIIAFHEKFGLGVEEEPKQDVSYQLRKYRIDRVEEEAAEFVEALRNGNLVKIAREGIDLLMVTLGTLVVFGIPIMRAWDAVHKANMNKEPVPGADPLTTKPIKPDGWTSPDADIAQALSDATAEGENDEPVVDETEDADPAPDANAPVVAPPLTLTPAAQATIAEAVSSAHGNSGTPVLADGTRDGV